MSSEKQIEQEIQSKNLNAPRLTPDHIDDCILHKYFFTAQDGYKGFLINGNYDDTETQGHPTLGCLTICVLVLKNGFTVTGESACASPENFDAEIGKKIAYGNAREKIWELEGYLLKEKLYQAELDKQF